MGRITGNSWELAKVGQVRPVLMRRKFQMNLIKLNSIPIQLLKFNFIQIQGLCFLVIASEKCVNALTTGIFLV